MNEEDQKIREMLADFRPEPQKSEIDFMASLQQRMDTVDIVKEFCRAEKRRNRCVVVIAALAGVLTGFGLTCATSYLKDIFGEVLGAILPWVIVAVGVLAAIFTAFFLTLLLPSGKSLKETAISPARS